MPTESNDLDIPVLSDIIEPEPSPDLDPDADTTLLHLKLQTDMRKMVNQAVETALADASYELQQLLCKRIETSLTPKLAKLIEQHQSE